MSKTAKDENFPVGKLIARPLRPLIQAYYWAARLADDTADDPNLPTAEKLQRLDELEKAFYTCGDGAAGELGRLFAAENLDSRLYADLLEAFRRDARGDKIKIWEQLLDYCWLFIMKTHQPTCRQRIYARFYKSPTTSRILNPMPANCGAATFRKNFCKDTMWQKPTSA